MQPWLQPVQRMRSSSRPSAIRRGRSGSAISARVMPTASAAPAAEQRLGLDGLVNARGGDQRHGQALRRTPAGSRMTSRATGGGGTIQAAPR